MYLSRVEIDRNNRRKIRDLTHLGAYHSWVEESFPQEVSQDLRSRKLWRVDTLYGRDYLLVISETPPDLEKLEKYGVEGSGETRDYSAFLNRLEEGMTVRFRAKLNPVKSLAKEKDGGGRGRVVPLQSIEDQMKYLLDRSEKNGFHLDPNDFTIVARGTEVLRYKGKRPVNLMGAEYEGRLTITDLEKFKKVLSQGLGRKKAYGFGMVTVIPYR